MNVSWRDNQIVPIMRVIDPIWASFQLVLGIAPQDYEDREQQRQKLRSTEQSLTRPVRIFIIN